MCVCVCVCVYYIFFIHSSVDEHLGSFHSLAIVDIAAVNIQVHRPLWITTFVSLGKYPVVGLLGPRVTLFSSLRNLHTVKHRGNYPEWTALCTQKEEDEEVQRSGTTHSPQFPPFTWSLRFHFSLLLPQVLCLNHSEPLWIRGWLWLSLTCIWPHLLLSVPKTLFSALLYKDNTSRYSSHTVHLIHHLLHEVFVWT